MRGIFIGLAVTCFFILLYMLNVSFLEMLESKLFDYRFKMRGPVAPSDKIVIAAIDEKSIERLGRWPWPRSRMAELVDRLSDAGAEVIVFDVIYSEQEANDTKLAQAIGNAGNVILPIVFDFGEKTSWQKVEIPANFGFHAVSNPERFEEYSPIQAKGVLIPVPQLVQAAMGWESLVIYSNGRFYPSTALNAAAYYLGVPLEAMTLRATEGVQLGKRFVPTDQWGRILINYYGPGATFRHLAVSDIIENRVQKSDLEGKIVIIGATAVGIYDLRVTPFSSAMPGVEKHANVIASLLENRFLTKASRTVNIAFILLTGIIFSSIVARLSAKWATVFTALLMFLVLCLGYGIFVQKGIWINIIYPSSNILLAFIGITAYHYAMEERYARRIREMFSNYVTDKIVQELIDHPEMAKIGGERRELTILFSDVRGFTSFSEKYAPEEVVAILNEYLGEMTDVIMKWGGTPDKFIGDAIMAFWGAPVRQDNHAELAVRCAVNMVSRLSSLQDKWRTEGKPVLDCGIGINTGEVIVGNIGAEGKKMDYTIIGDHVNLCSRIEGLTRKYNANILITEHTLAKIRGSLESAKIGHVHIHGLDNVVVKGKEYPVKIYELTSLDESATSCVTEVSTDQITRLKEK
jgi:adenylate cyclase